MVGTEKQKSRLVEDLLSDAGARLAKLAAQQNNADLNTVADNLQKGFIVESEQVFRSIAETYGVTEGVPPHMRADAYIDLAVVCLETDREKARSAILKAIELDPGNIKALAISSRFAMLDGDHDAARTAAEQAVAGAAGDGQARWQALAHQELGILVHVKGDLAAAERHYQMAIEGLTLAGDKEGAAETMGNLALVLRRQKKHEKAAPLFATSLEYWKSAGQTAEIIRTLGYLASVYFLQGSYDRASELFTERAQHNKAIDDKGELAADFANLGNVAVKSGDKETACTRWQQALQLYGALGRQQDAQMVSAMMNKHGCG